METMGKVIGSRIVALRRSRGINQKDLAGRLNIDPTYLSRIENGRRAARIELLQSIADELGVHISDIFAERIEENGVPAEEDVVTVDENRRAVRCPSCSADGYSAAARYCPMCGYSLYNVCTGEGAHVNGPEARFCEVCGSPTVWGSPKDE